MLHKQINIFIVLLITSILLIGCHPSEEEKIENIIEQLKLVETQRFMFEYQIEALKYQSTGKDSIRVCQLETELSEENVKLKIAETIKDKLSSKEIKEIYSFINSKVFNEFFMSGGLHEIISLEFEDVNKELEDLSQFNAPTNSKQNIDFIPIPVNRADGFYETLNYSRSSKDEEIEIAEVPVLTPKDIIKVTKSTERRGGIIEIDILFSKEGAIKFQQMTKDNVGKPLPIVVNKRIISMPTVNCEITGGRALISGSFTDNEADEIIKKLGSIAFNNEIVTDAFQQNPIKDKLLGAWGNDELGNAIFVFYPDSIYYPDANLWYKYSIISDTIEIEKENKNIEKVQVVEIDDETVKLNYIDYEIIEKYSKRK